MNTLYYGDNLKILRGRWHRDYPGLQIVTVEDLLAGKTISMSTTQMTFK